MVECKFVSDHEESFLGVDSIELIDGVYEMKCSRLTEENVQPETYVSDDGLIWNAR